MQPTTLFASFCPANCDLYVGIITSDYQFRTRWGWTGFDNASWDVRCLPDLLSPRCRVDVNHRRGRTISGYMVALQVATAVDHVRLQADWIAPRPVDYVLAVFALPCEGYAARAARAWRQLRGRVGVSIEHGGRRPRRTIGPFVTVCDTPANNDCWMIYDHHGEYLYPRDLQLSASQRENAMQLLSAAIELPTHQFGTTHSSP